MPAAGIAGLIKAALAVHHGVLPPTLHCDDPHPALARTRFTTVDSAVPWESDVHGPLRRAAVNAFGFGGINAHVVLEQSHAAAVSATSGHAGPAAVVREPERVLRLAATSPGELARLLDQEDTALRATATDTPLPGPAGPVRLGVVDPTAKRLALARKAVDRGRAWRGRNDVWFVPEPLLGAAAWASRLRLPRPRSRVRSQLRRHRPALRPALVTVRHRCHGRRHRPPGHRRFPARPPLVLRAGAHGRRTRRTGRAQPRRVDRHGRRRNPRAG